MITFSMFRNYLLFMMITSTVSYPMCIFLTSTGATVSLENLHFLKAFQYWLLLPLPLFSLLFLLLSYILKMLKKS
jgi:hypothetical protein